MEVFGADLDRAERRAAVGRLTDDQRGKIIKALEDLGGPA